MILLQSDFNLTQKQMEDAQIYDEEKWMYIMNYLLTYFGSKLTYLKSPELRIKCPEHDMEEFSVDDKCSIGHHGVCVGPTFADWQNTLSMHCDAKFKCGKKTFVGYTFTYRIKELLSVLEELYKIPNNEFIKGKKFSDFTRLTVDTPYMQNNFSTIPSYFVNDSFI